MRLPLVTVLALAGLWLGLGVGCDEVADTTKEVPRWHRFGILRDLVLFRGPPAQGGPFFLDRFETTVADYQSFVAAGSEAPGPGRSKPDMRPRVRVDLHDARRFAAWRFCRIPRAQEWTYACTQDGVYRFPWGDKWYETWANTGGLNLGRPVNVGSFESGRSPSGPYDLVGNVAEWTETVLVPFEKTHTVEIFVDEVFGVPERPTLEIPVAPDWNEASGSLRIHWPHEQAGAMPLGLRAWLPACSPLPRLWLDQGGFELEEGRYEKRQQVSLEMPGVADLDETTGLRCWLPAWSPAPSDWLIAAESEDLGRQVLGGHFLSLLRRGLPPSLPGAREWQPRRSDSATGIRLAADPEGLLVALLSYTGETTPAVLETLRRFLARPGHHRVLAQAWAAALRRVPSGGSLRPPLAAELAGG